MPVVLIATLSLLGQPKQRAAWEWTLEERIAARTNPELARLRLAETRSRVQTSSANRSSSQWVDEFDGKTHPELFLPHQVFDRLITMVFVSSNARITSHIREALLPEVRRRGLPNDFWSRLETITTIYVADERALNDVMESTDRHHPEKNRRARTLAHDDVCRSRAEALVAARQTFGRERFDRFLYEVIAIHMFTATDRLPDAALLRAAEEGCR